MNSTYKEEQNSLGRQRKAGPWWMRARLVEWRGGDGIRHGERQERVPEGQENAWNYVAAGRGEWEDSLGS